jgi:hypothetical protein
MNICTPLIAYPQPAPLWQPRQGPFHHPAIDTQATSVSCPAFGQHGSDSPRSQLLPMGLRIIATIPLHTARPTSGAPTLPPHRRDGLQQGQQLGDIVPMRAGHHRGHWNPLGIREHMMLTAALPTIGRIGPRFFPHRRPPGDADYQPRRGTNQSGRRREAWPGATHAIVARPLCAANRVGAANRSCRSRSPSLGAASPKEGRTSGQRAYLLTPPGSVLAAGPPAAWAVQAVRVEQATPRVRRVRVVLPCTHNTSQSGFVRTSKTTVVIQ